MRTYNLRFVFLVIIFLGFFHLTYSQTIPQKISFQGKLLENNIPVTGTKNISFEIDGSGWNENHTGVEIKNGLYSVTLGSVAPIPLSVFSNSNSAILKIFVEGNHLQPDTEILSAVYSYKSEEANNAKQLGGKQPSIFLNIESINGLAGDSTASITIIGDGNISVTNDTQQNTITISGASDSSIPSGVIVMWSGSINNIPSGWALCDGTNGTPDLINRFIVGAGNNYNVGDTGGEDSHKLSIGEVPSHDHLTFAENSDRGGYYISTGGEGAWKTMGGGNQPSEIYRTGFTGGDKSHENRPPYFALAYIMKK